jgi:hypothetical protein
MMADNPPQSAGSTAQPTTNSSNPLQQLALLNEINALVEGLKTIDEDDAP